MFNQLTRYVFAQWLPTTASGDGVETDTTRLTASETAEDDWVVVGRAASTASSDTSDVAVVHDVYDSDGGSRSSTPERLDAPTPPLDESWFLTPPPCFISTGPVHMETSPLENLLIEHPSMSVYTTHHHHRGGGYRGAVQPTAVVQYRGGAQPTAVVQFRGGAQPAAVVLVRPQELVEAAEPVEVEAVVTARVQVLQQQERQALKGRQQQKVQIKKACKFINRGSLNRNNKAREVNSRNRRQRRGERSQGATRSFANNNRKC